MPVYHRADAERQTVSTISLPFPHTGKLELPINLGPEQEIGLKNLAFAQQEHANPKEAAVMQIGVKLSNEIFFSEIARLNVVFGFRSVIKFIENTFQGFFPCYCC